MLHLLLADVCCDQLLCTFRCIVQVKTIIDGKEKTKKVLWPPGSDCPPDQPSVCNTGAREYSGVLLSSDEGKTWKVRDPSVHGAANGGPVAP